MARLPRRRLLLTALLVLTAACSASQHPRMAGAYRFTCTPPDARIILDEQDQGPCVLWTTRWLGVLPGQHRLRVLRDGHLPFEADLNPAGHRDVVEVHLRPIPD